MSTRKHFHRLLAFLLTLGILLGGLPAAAWAADAVDYVDPTGGGGDGIGKCENYTLLTSDMTTWTAGWYVADGNIQIDSQVLISGNVNLILKNGCTLTAKDGITLQYIDTSLTIWGQSGGTGTLTATTTTERAAIGYNLNYKSGAITINGGTVNASARMGAGIGGGASHSCPEITINGGTVTASSQEGGAGIGGGAGSKSAATITINGGTVKATGGTKRFPYYDTGGGAGIGHGEVSDPSVAATVTVIINGGAVHATGGGSAAGIGGGGCGYDAGGTGGTVTISGNSRVTANGGPLGGAGIGGGLGEEMGGSGSLAISSGNVFLNASSIGPDPTVASDASAILLDGGSGTIYGTATLPDGETLDIPAGKTLRISNGASLTVPNGTNLIVRSGATLNNEGTLQIDADDFIKEPGATVTGAGTTPGATTSFATPTASVDYINETLKGLAAGALYRIGVNGAEQTVTAATDGTISLADFDWIGKELSITRISPDDADKISDSATQALSIKPRPGAPQKLDVVQPTYKGDPGHINIHNDGVYQFRVGSDDAWMSLEWQNALPAGTYYVRFAPTVSDFASEAAEVVIKEATQENPYKIELDGEGLMPEGFDSGMKMYRWDLGKFEDGYKNVPAQALTITNKSEVNVTLDAYLSEEDLPEGELFEIKWGDEFSSDPDECYKATLAPGGQATVSIRPKDGLSIDKHSTKFVFFASFASADGEDSPYQTGIIFNAECQVVPAAPVFDPASTEFEEESLPVTITCPTEGAEIYYTTDGTEPKLSDTELGMQPADSNTQKYEQGITLTETTTVTAVSVKNNTISPPSTATYTKFHKVAFDSREGSPVESQRVEDGKPAAKPDDPAREGYTFGGWFTEGTCENEWDFTRPVTESKILYAKWTKNVAVTFISNGGSEVQAQAVAPGTKAAEPAAPTKEGYTFGGWYTDADCTAAWSFENPVDENITLYAKWTKNADPVTVTFNSNGGSEVNPLTVERGTKATEPAVPTKEGYTFGGWYADTDCTAAWNFESPVNENITLYAKWTKNVDPVTVTFNSNGGSVVNPQTVERGTKATEPAAPTKEGYTFGGWYTDAACTTEWSFDGAVTKDMTLYAKWTQNAVQQTVETPVISPLPAAGETFEESVTVSIACATDGAEIHYTTDGTIPTASSAKYTAPLTLTETTVVNAIAVKPGWRDSGLASASYTKKDAPALDGHEHAYTEEITKQPACTEPGEKTKTCTECGEKKTEILSALGHSYGEWVETKAPTCAEEGQKTQACIRCDDKKTETIPKLSAHTYGEWVETKSPTCTEAGERTQTCTVCKGTRIEPIPALGHAYDGGRITREPTLYAAGVRTFTCTRCGASYTESIPQLTNPVPDRPGSTPTPSIPSPPSQPVAPAPEQPGQDNWQAQPSATPEAGGGTAWKYVDNSGAAITAPQVLPEKDGTPRLYLFDGSGLLQTGAVSSSTAADGTEIRISPAGDVEMHGSLYYLNPGRVLTEPRSCYAVRNYMRALPGDTGSRFYDKNGITFEGWLRDADGKMRYQTVIQTETSGRYLLVVWRVQTLPACQDPDHPGDPAYMIPAGRYFFDDFGVLVTEEGWHDGKDGKEYYTNAKGQVLNERPRA